MELSEFLKTKAGLRDGNDLVSALRGGAGVLREEIERLQKDQRCREEALGAIESLARLDTGGGFGSYGYERSFFVAAYEARHGGPRPTLVQLECVIVIDAVRDQYRHRPKPQTSEQVATGSVTMTPTMVSGREIAEEAASRYAAGVRVGTYGDVLTEPCGSCGNAAVVYCAHHFDTSNDFQGAYVSRLCVRCPRVEEIAAASCDLYENLLLLPLKQPHRR